MNDDDKISDVTVGQLSRDMRSRLAAVYGDREAAAMVRLVFHALKGWDATQLIVNSDKCVSGYILRKTDEVISRLLGGEPLQYILGEARFYGMDLEVTPAVLIPRPETAELVDLIVSSNRRDDLRVLDIGTGSGAIAIALSRNLPFARVSALDVSADALAVACANAQRLHASIDFIQADVFAYEPKPQSLDIIVSNPPYITLSERKTMDRNVIEHEPPGALFVPDNNPLIYYSRIADLGLRALVPGGKLYFEINPLFADSLKSLLVDDGYSDVEIIDDSSRKKRFAYALKTTD